MENEVLYKIAEFIRRYIFHGFILVILALPIIYKDILSLIERFVDFMARLPDPPYGYYSPERLPDEY